MKTNVPESVPSVPKVSGAASLMATCTRRYGPADRKSTRLNSSHLENSYAVFCLKKNGVLIHQERIDDAANFDQLLPFPAVACDARYLACGHGADLVHRYLGDHAFEAASGHVAR